VGTGDQLQATISNESRQDGHGENKFPKSGYDQVSMETGGASMAGNYHLWKEGLYTKRGCSIMDIPHDGQSQIGTPH